jgi:hypothetical protein
MLDLSDPVVAFKVEMLERVTPATDAVVFGDMWRVEGGYTEKCLELGCGRALLVDAFETTGWLERRLADPERLDFVRGDFASRDFMHGLRATGELGVAFDVLLHQASLVEALHLMLTKVRCRFVVVQPALDELDVPQGLVYLPGNLAADVLYPLEARSDDYAAFDSVHVNTVQWIWGITPSAMTSLMRSEGFELAHEARLGPLPNPRWSWWGAAYERARELPDDHWSAFATTPGLVSS